MENNNIYKGLECHCNEFEKIPIHRRELGIAGDVATYGVAIGESYITHTLDEYLAKEGVEKWGQRSARMLIKLNGGLISFLQAKIEGKSNERALVETSTGIAIGSGTGYLATQNTYGKALIQKGTNLAQQTLSQTSKLASSSAARLAASKAASNTATKVGVSLLTRIATGAAAGAAAGSSFPIVGTIIGAVAGALIAGVVNDIIFAEEDKALAEDKAENERIAKLQSQYQDKINQITSYLTNNHYIELRELTELEAEMLCKNLSNLDMDSKSGIALMLSFPHYLKKESKQEVYTPLSPQGISFPYSSIIYLTTIKALKDTLKEYLPKAKKIVLYTPNPFVSLYTSSPFYIFNSNLSFFNPHLQYLLTSKDTQQWLYDTLFSLARDNREIIVYEWGGSIEELDFKESQANKKDLDSKDTNQSTNIQKQTKTYYLSPQGQKLKEKQPYCIRVIAKESKVFTILRDFITSFNTTKEQEVFRALEILLKDKESLEHLRQCIIKSLKEPIIESIYSLKETKDLNKEDLKENVEEVFNNLLGVIEKIYKEGSAYLYKQVLLFFLEIFNLFNIQSVFKKSNALNFGESLALSSNQTLLNVLKWANSKYNYALIHPILKIFTQDLVPLFALIENTMCHNTLILDDKMLIELSSFNLNSYPKIKANLEQNLAICIKSKEAVFGHLEDSHQANQKTANLENTESKEDKQSTNFQKQTSLKELESNLENTLKVA
ncbi:hypothetical protein [Helicobacter pullorum]|uniref:hypothetical protein n=2 Tax=Helicobacter pullorum TaxID=35818 RepID=UPI001F1EEB73|nr:hypothetical protein [Helicobacter pullorum]